MITDKNQIITLRGRLLEYNVLDKDACQASVSTPAINSHGIENATALVCIEYDKAENKFYHTVDLFDEEGFVEHYHEDFYLYITSEEAEQMHKDLFYLFNGKSHLLMIKLITAYVQTYEEINIEEGCIKIYTEDTKQKLGECADVQRLTIEPQNVVILNMSNGYKYSLSNNSRYELMLILNYLRGRFPL
jgi:hypothetical protein